MVDWQFGARTDQQLWQSRMGDRSLAMPLVQSLLEAFARGSLWHAVGLFHRAWYHLHLADEPACEADLAEALTAFERLKDGARAANCLDIRAQMQWMAGDLVLCLQTLDAAKLMAEDSRTAVESYVSMNLRGLCEWDRGHWDDALRCLTRAVLLAEQSGSAACLSNALANCGGFHNDMFNFDVARDLSKRAWDVAQARCQSSIWWTAGINAMLAYDALAEHVKAWEIGQTLLLYHPQMPPRKRVSYFSKLGFVALHAGAELQAQHCIAQALHHCGDKPAISELVWAQAQACVARQDYAQARQLTHARVEAPAQAAWEDTPLDVWRMLRTLAAACKGMKDYEAALHYEELAGQRYVELVGRSARANRVAIEVGLETQRTAWQRDEAVRMRREAEAEQQRLAALNAALDEASRAKTRLLAVASHDLRQPLHALGMYLASLHADLRPRQGMQKQSLLIERAEETVASLSGMFSTLLDLSRLEGGGIELNIQVVNLHALCERLVQEAATRSAASVRLICARSAPAKFGMTDAALLERCLRNLLENALKYAPGAGLCVAIRSSGGDWRIEVRDAGPGIALQHQQSVFEEFFRIEQQGSAVRGLGLGLSIVKRLCNLMGHALRLKSAAGKGTVFSISVAKSLGAVAEPPKHRGAHASGSLHLALVEDDPAVRDGTAALLERWGYSVDSAADAKPWLADAPLPAPDAAVVDYHLGAATDGLAVVGELRAAWGSQLPCLLVTAETAPEALVRIRASGVPYLPKPLQPARLRAWLAGVQAAERHR